MTTARNNPTGWNSNALKKMAWLVILPGLAAAGTPHWSSAWAAIAASIQLAIVATASAAARSSFGATRDTGIWIVYLTMDAFGFLAQIPLWRVAGATWWQAASVLACITGASLMRRRAYRFFERRRRQRTNQNSRTWVYLIPIGLVILGNRLLAAMGLRAAGQWVFVVFLAIAGLYLALAFHLSGAERVLSERQKRGVK